MAPLTILLACSDYAVKELEPGLSVAPAVVDFGAVPVGAFAEVSTSVFNPGQAPLDLDPPLAEGLALATLDSNTLAAGGSTLLRMRWEALGEGTATGVVTVTGRDLAGEVAWTAEGVVGSLTVDPASVTFASLLAGERDEEIVLLGNTGRADVRVEALGVEGDAGFDVEALGGTLPLTVAPGGTVPVRVGFTAPDTSRAEGLLRVRSDDPHTPEVTVPLAANLEPANNRPAITLLNPAAGAVFSMEQAWTLRAYALDVETPATELTVTFTSDRHGVLGTTTPDATGEALLDVVSTVEGPDRITATVRDGDGATSTDTAAIEVTPCRELTWNREESFGPDFDHTLFAINGSATHDPGLGEFVLTDSTWEGGAIYLDAPIWLERFRMELQFRVEAITGADGMAIAWVQGAAPEDLLGRAGEQLGVGAIPGAAGWVVELDVHSNGSRSDPSGDHVALVSLPDYAHVGAPVPVMELEDGVSRRLSVDFDLGHLVVALEGTVVLETDVPGWAPFEGYLGITAATGALANRHVLESWGVETGCW